MKTVPLIYAVFFLCVILNPAFAQKWGEITPEELNSTDPTDPEAKAVVLFDIGVIKINKDFELVIERWKRIKVLSEVGKDQADIKISIWHEDQISDIEAVSYQPNGSESELDGDQIFEEKDNNIKTLSFAIPGVETGSVFEFRYRYFSKYLSNLEPWYFQSETYTQRSEIQVYMPMGFQYSALTSNMNNEYFVKKEEETWDEYRRGDRITKFAWTGTNLPAVKDEPFIGAYKDYYAQIYFQMVSFKNEYVNIQIGSDWNKVTTSRRKSYFEAFAKPDFSDLIKKNTADSSVPYDKMDRLYQFVAKEIKTGNRSPLAFPESLDDLSAIVKNGEGSVIEKNLLLTALLRQAGLAAEPILISRVSNGKVNKYWINTSQFNHVIVRVVDDKTIYFLDTEYDYYPPGYLPISCLTDIGLLLSKESAQIVSIIRPKMKNKIHITTNATVNSTGDWKGSTTIDLSGYPALITASFSDTSWADDFKSNLKDDYETMIIDSIYYLPGTPESYTVRISYTMPKMIQTVGSIQTLSVPFLATRNNPFKSSTRTHPVNFSYEFTLQEKIILSLPDGLSVSELPKREKVDGKSFSYSQSFFKYSSKVEMNRIFKLKESVVHPQEYEGLRYSFSNMTPSLDHQIILESSGGGSN